MKRRKTPQRKNLRKAGENNKEAEKTFLEHSQELKNRLIIWFIVFVLFSCIGYLLRDTISSILLKPLDQKLYFSSPSGGFNYIFSISIFFGFVASIPLLVYELIIFIEPAFPANIKNFSIKVLGYSSILMMIGILFAYYIVLPRALNFLLNWGGDNLQSLISTTEYFSFVTKYLLGFGVLFELPLVMVFINKVHRLEVKDLWKFEKWVILISFVLAAILTPTPDVMNQLIMAIPIILLYQISMLIVWIINSRS